MFPIRKRVVCSESKATAHEVALVVGVDRVEGQLVRARLGSRQTERWHQGDFVM